MLVVLVAILGHGLLRIQSHERAKPDPLDHDRECARRQHAAIYDADATDDAQAALSIKSHPGGGFVSLCYAH